jgi:hypothetical protein
VIKRAKEIAAGKAKPTAKPKAAPAASPTGAKVVERFEDGSAKYADGTLFDPEEQRFRRPKK